MNWSSRWSPLQVLIFILLKCGTTRPMVALEESAYPRLIVAASHTALSGDLGVLIIELPSPTEASTTTTSTMVSPISASTSVTTTMLTTPDDVDLDLDEDVDDEDFSVESSQVVAEDPYVLRVLRLDGFTSELVGEVPVDVPNVAGTKNVSLKIPCGLFSRGGTYSLELQHKSAPVPDRFTDAAASFHDAQMRTTLDVRWPTPSLALEPQHFDTYPSQPVLATLEYTGISCAPAPGVPVPTYTVQLIYCGASVLSCDPRNRSHVQMLYAEEVKGFPVQRVISLRCEFFGLAGHYALRLKPSDANPTAPTTSAYIKVEWSDLFVFNVHARSIYPCDGSTGSTGNNAGGVSVLFQYPSCRLAGDRVRVYGRLRADVASLAPPSTLHYVAELKAPPGKHSLTFDCDLFTEKYVEYCFVYISQAYNGAMSEVRADCIPTFPLQEGDAGGWGPWSQWTPCSSSCVGGSRNRHRFCDTPPPRYGAKFCQGETVETETCGGSTQLDLHGTWSPGDWECRHGEGLAADRPEVTAEVGAKCRCGCALGLEHEDEQPRLLAASSHGCPGKSFWLVHTRPDHVIRLYFDQARFPCQGQYARVRDGDSLIDEMLADMGPDRKEPTTGQVMTTGPRLLLEFFNEEPAVEPGKDVACLAGFLAHVTMIPRPAEDNSTTIPAQPLKPKVTAAAGRWALWLTPAHLVAASLLVLTFLVSVLLALQYAFKYRKYQVAEDLDSLTDNSVCSGSMQGIARRARAMSSSTLISEVVSLVRLPRRVGSPRHARLDETTADVEEGYDSTETQPDGDDEEAASTDSRPRAKAAEAEEQDQQSGSQRTIVASTTGTPTPGRRCYASSASSGSTATLAPAAAGQAEVKYARPVKLRTFGPVSPVSEEAASTSEDGRRLSATSASTSLNNGFSPVSTSSNSTLRRYSGKESKDRRNRERLLQGPGSEFSLANPDLDLELDYYDYNVTNAGAAPGSYLGMDPAFLVWIPPLTEDEADTVPEEDREGEEEEPHYEEIPERLSTEGAALTPSEYRRVVRLSHQEDSSENDSEDIIRPKRLDPGECRLHDEIIMEYKARLGEGMLPIHRILEESRIRVSEESLSSTSDVIPNRLEGSKRKPAGSTRLPKRTKKSSRTKNAPSKELSSESSTQSLDGQELNAKATVNDLDTPRTRRRLRDLDRDYCEVNISNATVMRTPNLPRRSQPAAAESIPLAEFSRNRQDSPVKVHRRTTKTSLQSPDYGVDVDESKESFYDLIGEGEDGIKFADDDDEYIDNKVVV